MSNLDKNNHTALDFFHRMDYAYQGRTPPLQLSTMTALYYTIPSATYGSNSSQSTM